MEKLTRQSTLEDEPASFCWQSQSHTVETSNLLLWPPSGVGLVVDIVPCDDIVETRGNGASHSEDEPPLEGLPQQPQDLLALLAGRQEGGASGAAVPDAGVRVLGLQTHNR